MRSFTYAGAPSRVVFGAGAVAGLAAEVDRLGAKRALVLSTPGRNASVRAAVAGLGERLVGIYDKALMHVPVELAPQPMPKHPGGAKDEGPHRGLLVASDSYKLTTRGRIADRSASCRTSVRLRSAAESTRTSSCIPRTSASPISSG